MGDLRRASKGAPSDEWSLAERAGAFIGMRSGSMAEWWFRFAMYLRNRDFGVSPRGSAAAAERSLFDYSEVGTAIDWMQSRVWGGNFIVFLYKALPYIIRQALKHPVRFSKWVLAVYLLTFSNWVLAVYFLILVGWLALVYATTPR